MSCFADPEAPARKLGWSRLDADLPLLRDLPALLHGAPPARRHRDAGRAGTLDG